MPIVAKDIVDLVTKCEERFRQQWIAFAALTYGLPLLLAQRDDHCLVRLPARAGFEAPDPLDAKEWLPFIFPLFSAFFIWSLAMTEREWRAWTAHALQTPDIGDALPESIIHHWQRRMTTRARARRDVGFTAAVVAFLYSGFTAIFFICTNPNKGWYAHMLSQGWCLVIEVPLALAALGAVIYAAYRLFCRLEAR